jgi:hypothetical protein
VGGLYSVWCYLILVGFIPYNSRDVGDVTITLESDEIQVSSSYTSPLLYGVITRTFWTEEHLAKGAFDQLRIIYYPPCERQYYDSYGETRELEQRKEPLHVSHWFSSFLLSSNIGVVGKLESDSSSLPVTVVAQCPFSRCYLILAFILETNTTVPTGLRNGKWRCPLDYVNIAFSPTVSRSVSSEFGLHTYL